MKTLLTVIALALSVTQFTMAAQDTPQEDSKYILTPKASPAPRINGAKVYGASLTGESPVTGIYRQV